MMDETFTTYAFKANKVQNYSSDDSTELEMTSRDFVSGMEKNVIKVKRLSRTRSHNLKLERWDSNVNDKSPSEKSFSLWETSSSSSSSSSIGDQTLEIEISKLCLHEIIARGSYGVTYLASYDGVDSAVKLLEWGEEDTMSRAHLSVLKKAFAREAELWNQLSHPNLAKFIGASISDDGFMIPRFRKEKNGGIRIDGNVCCIVLEHLPGWCLRDFLIRQSSQKLNMRQRMKLALDVANGLAYLHSKGLVHHALKCENLMLDKKGVVKIADFGLGGKGSVSYYESSSSNGIDICNIAPEVILGGRYTEKSEVYAFGFCLLEIFLCNIPLSDKLIHEGLLSGESPRIPSQFPPKVTSILSKCWEKSPHNRLSMKSVFTLLKLVSEDMEKNRGFLKYFKKFKPFSNSN